MRTLCFAAAAVMAAASVAPADDGNTFQWQGSLAPGRVVIIRGVSGSIQADPASDSQAQVTATKSANTSDPASVSFQVAPFDGGVVICAMYPDGDPDHPNTCNPPGQDQFSSVHNNDVSVQFVVSVPAGVLFAGSLVNGGIQANNLTATVQARTVSGNIMISTAGSAEATTNKGSILASIGAVDWSGVNRFATIDGSIDLTIPAASDVTVHARTLKGTIDTDFPLRFDEMTSGGRLDGTLGSDGRILLLDTLTGSIHLRQGQ